jgi:hypothetical protein
MKITGALKQKAPKVITPILPKRRRELTDNMASLISTSSEMPTQTSDNETVNSSTVINVDSDTDKDKTIDEDDDAKLGIPLFLPAFAKMIYSQIISECLKKDWNAPIYAFFQPIPGIDYENGQHFHEFTCGAKGCKKKVQHYLDKKDANSTGNL